jgi:hypothetical protein
MASNIRRTPFVAITDVLRALDAWATSRKLTPLTEADMSLIGAWMRWVSIRDRRPSAPPPPLPVDSAPTFDPEAPTHPGRPGLSKTRP